MLGVSLIQTPATNRIIDLQNSSEDLSISSCYLSWKQTPTTTYRLFCPTPKLRLSTNLSAPKKVSPSLCFRRIPKRKWKWKTQIPTHVWVCEGNRIFKSIKLRKSENLGRSNISQVVLQSSEVCIVKSVSEETSSRKWTTLLQTPAPSVWHRSLCHFAARDTISSSSRSGKKSLE